MAYAYDLSAQQPLPLLAGIAGNIFTGNAVNNWNLVSTAAGHVVVQQPQPTLNGTGNIFTVNSMNNSNSVSTTAGEAVVFNTYDAGQWQTVSASLGATTRTISTVEPMVPGTNIPTYRVTALLDGGMTVKEVMEDFPSLSEAQINQAREFAKTFPNIGRQYPGKSLKRLLRRSGFHKINKELTELRGARSVSAR